MKLLMDVNGIYLKQFLQGLVFSWFFNKFNCKWNPRKRILKGFVYFQQKRGLVDMFGEKV